MELVREYLPLVIGVGLGLLFLVGLTLALRTETGREKLGEAAVRFAEAALVLAERWLTGYLEQERMAVGAAVDTPSDIRQARVMLGRWRLRRALYG
jgi:hypothetical protein